MKNNLLFDFTVDKTTKTVFINREFAAGLSHGMGCFYQTGNP
jgi:hypothetical protein